jgi:hypothetical protein
LDEIKGKINKIPIGARDFPLVQNVQTGTGPHTASYSVDTGVHSLIFSAEVTNEWSYISIRMELQFHPDPARKLSTNLYDIYHSCVYSEKTPDDGHRNCPKLIEFHSNNKFQKLVHLVGFIIQDIVHVY